MDINKTRKLLGKEAEGMTDEEIFSLEDRMRQLADVMLDIILNMTPKERKALDVRIKKEKHGY